MSVQLLDRTVLGPFVKGVITDANPSLDTKGALRAARNAVFNGVGRLIARPGTEVAMTLMDDQGTPAEIDRVLAIVPFGDGALAVGWSDSQDDVYLYKLTAELDDWYDSTGALGGSLSAEPMGVLWSSVTSAPAVSIAEGLGTAYIAHNSALDASAITYPTKTFDGSTTIATLTADLDGTGADNVAFLGVCSYMQHLWGWGYDQGTVAASAYRPELIRHGGPNFAALDADGRGSFTVGHNVRSARERVTCMKVAGEVLYAGTNFSVWAIVGYDRDTWQKKSLDNSFGIVGLKAACEANGVLYYWSHMGPMRVSGLSQPEPLWDAIASRVASIGSPQAITAVFDDARDQVLFIADDGTYCAFDVRRDVWLGPDSAFGVAINCAGRVSPVLGPAVAGSPPAGAPTAASTTSVGSTTATANWTAGDSSGGTTSTVEYKRQSASEWTVFTTVVATVASVQITGLTSGGIEYHWRVKHTKNGQDSAYLGPSASTEFTTSSDGGGGGGTLNPPTGLTLVDMGTGTTNNAKAQWTNSGESGVSTEVYGAGPSATEPASFSLIATKGVGVSSHTYTVTETGVWWVKVRHVKSGSTESSFTSAASATITYNPGGGV